MEEICSGCLTKDRKLCSLQDISYSHIFSQILNEIFVYDLSSTLIKLCWECCSSLRRFQQFKQQVKWSYNKLLQDGPKVSVSKLRTSVTAIISYPEEETVIPGSFPEDQDIVVKEEIHNIDDVKSEGDSMHCEPEAFVNDLQIETDYLQQKKSKKKVKLKKIVNKKLRKKSKDRILFENEDTNKQTKDYSYTSDIESGEVEPPIEPVTKKPTRQTAPREREDLPDKPQCVECGKIFSSKKTYRYHRNVIHRGQNRHPCPRCGKVYQWKSNLGRHMRTHKAVDNGELYCEKCDKSFASVATFRQHLKIAKTHVSESEFSFVCNECGKKFATQTRLRDHIDWDHLKKIKFKCELCNKSFKSYTSQYVHTQHFHNNKAKKDNLCHVCGKSYQNAAKLKYHITAMHSGETPHRCAHCAAAFGWYTSLYRHVREVHYKIKMHPKKAKKQKKADIPDLIFAPNFVVPAPGPS